MDDPLTIDSSATQSPDEAEAKRQAKLEAKREYARQYAARLQEARDDEPQRKRPPKTYPYLVQAARLTLYDGLALLGLTRMAAQFWPVGEEVKTRALGALEAIVRNLHQALGQLEATRKLPVEEDDD